MAGPAKQWRCPQGKHPDYNSPVKITGITCRGCLTDADYRGNVNMKPVTQEKGK